MGGSLQHDLTRIPHVHLLLEVSPCPEFPVGIFSWKALRCLIPSLRLLLGEHTNMFYFNASIAFLGEGNGTPLQYSCLENPMDGGAW